MSSPMLQNLGDAIFGDIDSNPFLNELYDSILYNYAIVKFDLAGKRQMREIDIISALRFADLLSKSTSAENKDKHKMWAQEIIILLNKLSGKNSRGPFYYKTVDMLLKRDKKPHFVFASPNIPNPEVYLKLLSESKQKTIREHFPNADSVGIISKPEQFLQDVMDSIGTRVEHEAVHYFNIDKGFKVDGSNQIAMDMEYMKYLVQDVPPVIENGMKKYSFRADYVYRVLFCKDVFFQDEQEYRIVLPDEKITKGTAFPIKLSDSIQVLSIDNLFNKKEKA